jgi:ribonuclease T1
MLRNVLGPVAARFGAAGLLAVSLWGGLAWAKAPPPLGQDSTVALAQLPAQGQKTYELIAQGGPFPYDKDGTVFGNRERTLPSQKRGFYREYTVKTPYERSRGAKRIVCGGEKPAAPEVCYYTDDHYASFRKIVK